MKNKLYLIGILTLVFCANTFAQLTLPRESQRAEVIQTIGDTKVSFVYHRPNIKGRTVWADAPAGSTGTATLDGSTPNLVNYGHIWRVGANENTTFEVSNDVKINGQTLPAGKYGLHSIPGPNEWTIIFNKVNNAWGSYSYDAKNDQLRITVKPQPAEFQETMSLGVENINTTSGEGVIRWEKLRVPFTIDIGDLNGRTLAEIRKQMGSLKADDFRTPIQGAGWILEKKLTANYDEAIGWTDTALKVRETVGGLSTKAQLLAAAGKKQEAIAAAEKAVQIGKAATPAANVSGIEKMIADWKAGK